ncbi:MAG: phage holin family protein [Anaerorhabdus sp.]
MKKIVATILALWFIEYFFEGVQINDVKVLVTLALVLAVLNLTIKPILKFLSLPITFITFGLFSLVINTVILELAFSLVEGAAIQNHWMAFLAALVIAVANSIAK